MSELVRGENVGRFSFLLGVMLIMLTVGPFLEDSVEGSAVFRVLFTGLYISGVAAVAKERRGLVIGIAAVLAVPAIFTEWVTVASDREGFLVTNLSASMAFLSMTSFLIFRAVLRERNVTADTVLGGICVYLLLGMLFVEFYALAEYLEPGSISVGGHSLTELRGVDAQHARYPRLVYFSFVTLTTLGYGDITPVSTFARSLATVQAVVGQLYIAIFVARLVGLQLAGASRQD